MRVVILPDSAFFCLNIIPCYTLHLNTAIIRLYNRTGMCGVIINQPFLPSHTRLFSLVEPFKP